MLHVMEVTKKMRCITHINAVNLTIWYYNEGNKQYLINKDFFLT